MCSTNTHVELILNVYHVDIFYDERFHFAWQCAIETEIRK